MTDKIYSVPELKVKLAKHVKRLVCRMADDIQDLAKRELFKNSVLGAAHEEPGVHENQEVGTPPHMEPGDHEAFTMDPPPGPDSGAATAQPVAGGMGVPGGAPPPAAPGVMSADANGGPCPVCGQPDQPGSCTCLDQAILKSENLQKFMSGLQKFIAQTGGGVDGGQLQLAEEPMCKGCGKMHKASAACMDKAEPSADGRNKNPSKQQPSPPVKGAVMPGTPKIVKGPDDNKVKKNPLGKADWPPGSKPRSTEAEVAAANGSGNLGKAAVPEAKPPTKAPTAAPPMASNTSKPVAKEELEKGILPQAGAVAAPRAPSPAATGARPPLPTGAQPIGKIKLNRIPAPAAAAPAKPVMGGAANFGRPSPFGKSEKCVLCNKTEHPGACK